MGVPRTTTMRPTNDSSESSPDERRHELAAILAAGVQRLHQRGLLAETGPESQELSPSEGLDERRKTVLTVHAG